MHTIHFEVLADGGRDRPRQGTIHLLINGVDLIDLVRTHELPFARSEGSPSIAGAYAGLPVSSVLCPNSSNHFWGEASSRLYKYGDKIQLLECECGEPGCWPLICRITVRDEVVSWSDFEQPHRSRSRSQSVWSYEGFGPFLFRKQQYEIALDVLEKNGRWS